MVRIVSLSVLLTLIVILGLTFFKVLAPFILPLFLAAVFAILCQPIYAYFLERTKNRVRVASGLTTAAVISIILVPLILGTVLASLQLFVVATNLSDRNLGRTLREKTEPILQHVADFVNARMRPGPNTDGTPAEPDQTPDSTDEDSTSPDADASPTSSPDPPTDPAASTTAATISSGESVNDDTSQAAVEESTAPAGELSVEGGPVAATTMGSGESDASSARAPPQPITAESLRKQVQVWLRDSLSQIGRKSLGMAGGTLDLLSGSVVAVGSAALSFAIFAIALYYFLADGTQLVRATERLIPVHVEYQRQILNQFSRVVRAVVMATFFAALAQAIATVAALWLFGFDHLFIIFVLALLMSMIPMMGTWLVWLPCAGYLLYNGHWFQAILLTIYGSAFVGMLDNVVRTYVLNTDVKLHPLLALISVLGGLQVMGLWGMFVGPIVASCLHALVQIFNHELAALSKDKFAGLEGLDRAPLPDAFPPPVIPTPPVPTVAKDEAPAQNEVAAEAHDEPPTSNT